jgi:hypothetical protein
MRIDGADVSGRTGSATETPVPEDSSTRDFIDGAVVRRGGT